MVSSMARCAGDQCDLRPGVTQVFRTPKHARCETDAPIGKAALSLLCGLWPQPLPVAELFARASQALDQAGLGGELDARSAERLREILLALYSAGVVELRTILPPAVWTPGPKPAASPLARWQIERGDIVTTLLHFPVQVEDEIGRSLLKWLDGTLTRDELWDRLWRMLQSKNALRVQDGDEAAARRQLQLDLDANLAKLAKLALLIA
jgi:hypothetical protein